MPDPLDLTDLDIAQALRMPILHEFFSSRSVGELLMDLSWLSQYLIYRQHTEALQQAATIAELKHRSSMPRNWPYPAEDW